MWVGMQEKVPSGNDEGSITSIKEQSLFLLHNDLTRTNEQRELKYPGTKLYL